MTEDELGAWRVYLSLNPYNNDKEWEELDKENQSFYLKVYDEVKVAAQQLSDRIEKEVYSKLVDQEHWT